MIRWYVQRGEKGSRQLWRTRLKTKGLGGQMGKGGNGKALQRFSHRQDAKVLYLKVDGFSLLPFPHFPIFPFKRMAKKKGERGKMGKARAFSHRQERQGVITESWRLLPFAPFPISPFSRF